MSQFSDLLAEDAASVFLNTDEHAETVRLYPPDEPDAIEVTAIVERGTDPLEENPGERRRLEVCTVHVRAGVRRDGRETIAADDPDGEGVRLVTQLGMRLEGDGADDLWDFREVVDVSGGMVTARFHRVRIERTGDLTARLG